MKYVLTIAMSSLLVGCAVAQPRGFSDAYESVEHAKVVAIEPIKTTTYHRVPKTSCTTKLENGMITERCNSYQDAVYTSRTTGYKVMFEYRGTTRSVLMQSDPGSHVTLKIVTNVYVLE